MNPSWKPMPTNSIQTYFPDMPTDTDFMEKTTTQTIKRVSVITTDTFPDNGKTSQSSGGSYSFGNIYSCNYFFEKVLPEFEAGTISGAEEKIRQYIGEMYFMRAYEYFKRLRSYGDFPIVKATLPDQMEPLVEASKRSPRNEVARFILSDLDSAIEMMSSGETGTAKKPESTVSVHC